MASKSFKDFMVIIFIVIIISLTIFKIYSNTQEITIEQLVESVPEVRDVTDEIKESFEEFQINESEGNFNDIIIIIDDENETITIEEKDYVNDDFLYWGHMPITYHIQNEDERLVIQLRE